MVIEEIIGQTNNEEEAKKLIQQWRGIKKLSEKLLLGIFGATVLLTSFYTVPADSMGVVRRFGAYARTTEPGLHVKIPLWVESADKVPVKKVQKEEFGFRTLKAGVDTQFLNRNNVDQASMDDLIKFVRDNEKIPSGNSGELREQVRSILNSEYLMLTGDLNIADVSWLVQYQIKDPVAYLFNIQEPGRTIRDSSQAVMREIIGNGSIDEAITIGRIENENSAKEKLQQLLDDYDTGIHVVAVKLQSSNPPERVRPAFNKVNESMQQKEQKINNARQEYNTIIPRAIGETQREIENAQGYAIERVNEAQGDVQKFLKLLEEYKKAPDITKQRLYLETMAKLLPKIKDKTIVEDKGLESGFYRMFNLDMKGGKNE